MEAYRSQDLVITTRVLQIALQGVFLLWGMEHQAPIAFKSHCENTEISSKNKNCKKMKFCVDIVAII